MSFMEMLKRVEPSGGPLGPPDTIGLVGPIKKTNVQNFQILPQLPLTCKPRSNHSLNRRKI